MFMWSGGTLTADIPITVSGGVFKLVVTTANVFVSSGTITMNGTGQFDHFKLLGEHKGVLRKDATGVVYLQMAETMPSMLLEGDEPHLIDEWQVAPNLWDAVRFAFDKRGGMGHFILTGFMSCPLAVLGRRYFKRIHPQYAISTVWR